MKQTLIDTLDAMTEELQRSGKSETASFFAKAKEKVSSECNGNQGELKEVLTGLETSGAMTQYANFSAHEEALWEKVYEAAKNWHESLG